MASLHGATAQRRGGAVSLAMWLNSFSTTATFEVMPPGTEALFAESVFEYVLRAKARIRPIPHPHRSARSRASNFTL